MNVNQWHERYLDGASGGAKLLLVVFGIPMLILVALLLFAGDPSAFEKDKIESYKASILERIIDQNEYYTVESVHYGTDKLTEFPILGEATLVSPSGRKYDTTFSYRMTESGDELNLRHGEIPDLSYLSQAEIERIKAQSNKTQ
ncbi:hypothetical protein [Coraliomargarita parva]|uniref:hypothetical protein n=1 Tax=Coraliomargarita parva TaxID=3014050 RepID=UPI0022B36D3F|nr:hypothetical protein [Coraliomargarita parva]